MSLIDKKLYGSSLLCCVCVYAQATKIAKAQSLASKQEAGKPASEQQRAATVICKGCKLLRYCSLEHLVQDYTVHREFCLVLQSIQKLHGISHPLMLNGKISTRRALQETIAQLKLALRIKLKRALTPRELDTLSYPPYCFICYKLDDVTACLECGCVAFCSDDHREMEKDKHVASCRTLAISRSAFKLLPLNDGTIIRKWHQPSKIDNCNLVKAFTDATAIEITMNVLDNFTNYERFALCSSFNGIANICSGLTFISFKVLPNEVLKIYVIIARKEQQINYFQKSHLKFFFLQYQDVTQLELYLIGPDVVHQKDSDIISFLVKGCKRVVIIRTFPNTFKAFTKNYRVDATMIMLFEPDFAGMTNLMESIIERFYPHAKQVAPQDYWYGSIKELLFTYNVPICYTSKSLAHASADYAAICEVARDFDVTVRRMLDIEDNPYRGMLPYFNHCPDEKEPILYENNYKQVIFAIPQ